MDVLPGNDSMFWTVGRVKTFQNWPFQSNDKSCNPQRMAAAGFYCLGDEQEPDLVECFICGKQLDGWEPNDDPWDEHLKHQSSCPFLMLGKKDESAWTIQDLFEMFKKFLVKECAQEVNKAKAVARDSSVALASKIPQICKNLRKSVSNS